MKSKNIIWIICFFVISAAMLFLAGWKVVTVDPFFHYHLPDTSGYYYELNNERSQNDGIIKHFEYDAVITGTSMTENFRTSLADRLFGKKFIKIPFSGATFKEIDDNLETVLRENPDIQLIIRGLDMNKFADDKDAMREDLGEFPTYLYDDQIFNDVRYVFNRNVIFDRVYPMIRENNKKGFEPGITSFDQYANWMKNFTFGMSSVARKGIAETDPVPEVHMTEEEREVILASTEQNITSLARAYPDVDFYYFFTPYSAVWWNSLVKDGTIRKQLEMERLVIEEILECDNIRLFSFNNLTDLTTDINNYKDITHYGIWINDLILNMMKDGKCLLTKDNYEAYLEAEEAFYTSFDYLQLNEQEDYEADYYSGALLNERYYGVVPLDLSGALEKATLKNAVLVDDQFDGSRGISCTGTLQREKGSKEKVADYLLTHDYVGASIMVDDIRDYKYLSFYGMKVNDHGQPGVYIYDLEGNILTQFNKNYKKIDEAWHHYVVDVSGLEGPVKIIFNGGYTDQSGKDESQYIFSKIMLY